MAPKTPLPEASSVTGMLDQLWLKFLPQIEERLSVLDRAAAELAQGDLSPALRQEAQSAAHKLAGSLGMFGLDEGTALGREAENLLAPEANLDLASRRRIAQLVAKIRATINKRCL